jgi:hypothetical protein
MFLLYAQFTAPLHLIILICVLKIYGSKKSLKILTVRISIFQNNFTNKKHRCPKPTFMQMKCHQISVVTGLFFVEITHKNETRPN